MRKLGGAARRWRFDRMATVCYPSNGQVTAAFAAVAKYYGVGVDICPPRRGNRKEVVEKANHSAAQRWWRTVPDGLTVVQAQSGVDKLSLRMDDRRRRIDGAVTTVGELAAAEALLDIPVRPFLAELEVERTVSPQSLVAFDGNLYSVPPGLPGVTVKVLHRLGEDDLWIVTAGRAVFACHRRARRYVGSVCDHLCRSEIRRCCSEWVRRATRASWNPVRVIASPVYRGTRKPPSVAAVLLRRRAVKEAESLVLRHGNAVLRRQLAGAVRAGRPDPVRRAVRVVPATPMGAGVPGHARDPARAAPQTHRGQVGLQQAPLEAGRATDHRRGEGAGAATGPGESAVGLSTDPGRTRPPRTSDRHHDGRGDPDGRRHETGPTPQRAGRARVPDRAAGGLLACDLLPLALAGLRRVHAPVLLEHGTRRPHSAGATTHPTGQRTVPPARNLAVEPGPRPESPRVPVRDRDRKYTDSFDAEDMDMLLSAPQAPRMNAPCERVIGTIRHEDLDHILIVHEAHAPQVLAEYQEHYTTHRPHRSRGQRPPEAREQPAVLHDHVPRRLLRTRVLGEVIDEYRYTA